MALSASDYTKMTSEQRIAFLRSLPRSTVQEADAPRCQCQSLSLWRSGGAWRCLTCDRLEPTGTVTEAVRAIISQAPGMGRRGAAPHDRPAVPAGRRRSGRRPVTGLGATEERREGDWRLRG